MAALKIYFSKAPQLTLQKAEKDYAILNYSASAYGDSSKSYDFNSYYGDYIDEEKTLKNYYQHIGSYTLNTIEYEWKFQDSKSEIRNSQSGTYNYDYKNVSTGEKCDLLAECTISATETDRWYTYHYIWKPVMKEVIVGYEKDENDNFILDENEQQIPIIIEVIDYYEAILDETTGPHSSTTPVESITATTYAQVYTPPTAFTDYNFSKDTIIQSSEGLSATKVSNWCTHAGKYLSWRDQKDRYDDANFLKVIDYFKEEKPIITAAWYNDCADLVGCMTEVSNDHSQANSLITAQIFKDLGAAISP